MSADLLSAIPNLSKIWSQQMTGYQPPKLPTVVPTDNKTENSTSGGKSKRKRSITPPPPLLQSQMPAHHSSNSKMDDHQGELDEYHPDGPLILPQEDQRGINTAVVPYAVTGAPVQGLVDSRPNLLDSTLKSSNFVRQPVVPIAPSPYHHPFPQLPHYYPQQQQLQHHAQLQPQQQMPIVTNLRDIPVPERLMEPSNKFEDRLYARLEYLQRQVNVLNGNVQSQQTLLEQQQALIQQLLQNLSWTTSLVMTTMTNNNNNSLPK